MSGGRGPAVLLSVQGRAERERLLLEESDRLAVPGATAKSLNPSRPQRERKKTLGSCQLPVFGKKAGIFLVQDLSITQDSKLGFENYT